MRKKFDKRYKNIVSVDTDDENMHVSFENGDEVTLKKSTLVAEHFSDLRWDQCHIETSNGDGVAIFIPAKPRRFEISWHGIRCLTDSDFAKEFAERQVEQARQIGATLKELRQKKGITQEEVAKVTGIRASNLSRIENGNYNLNTSTVLKILSALNSTWEDMTKTDVAQELHKKLMEKYNS